MLDNVADGFLGFFMFFAQWLSPGAGEGDIRIAAVKELSTYTSIECIISIEWNDRMIDLVDAGIPVRFSIASMSDKNDTVRTIRTLFCDVSEYTYFITDSLISRNDSVYHSKKFTQIYRAIKEYQHFERTFSKDATDLNVDAVLLPSQVNHLNRSIDMSNICNCRRFTTRLIRKKPETP